MLILLLMATTSNVAGPWAMDRHSGNQAHYEASIIDEDTSEITPNEDNATPNEDPCIKWVAVTPSEDLPTQAWPAALPSGDSPLDSPLYVGRAESGEGVLPLQNPQANSRSTTNRRRAKSHCNRAAIYLNFRAA